MRAKYLPPIFAVVLIVAPTLAKACAVVDGAAYFAESQMASCAEQLKGSALNACVGSALSGFSSGVQASPLKDVAARAPGAIATAANQVTAADKAGAVSALNRARSVISALAAQSGRESQFAYNRINQVFARAIGVINAKG
jgi:hypothetical protein